MSGSMKRRSSVRRSITVTLTPRAAKMHAYSQPITPPPSTATLRGTSSRFRIESLSQIIRSSNGIESGRRGRLPVAMTMRSASITSSPWRVAIRTRWGPTKEADPERTRTRFRSKNARIVCWWFLITEALGPMRSWIVSGRRCVERSPMCAARRVATSCRTV